MMHRQVRYDFAELDLAGRPVREQGWSLLDSGVHSFTISIEPSGVYLVSVGACGQRLTSGLAVLG